MAQSWMSFERERIKTNMTIGFRAFTDFERPSPELIEAYRSLPSANIGDCCYKMNCMFDGIHSFNDIPLCGPAFTVKVPAGDNLVAQLALDYAKPGDIIVIDGAGFTNRALVGGMMVTYAKEKQLGGFVVNGAIRDVDDIKNSPIPVYGITQTPLGPYRSGPGEMNVPVCCGGQVVMPGDIIVGDHDGIVVIPQKDAEELLQAVRNNLAHEQTEMKKMKSGIYTMQEHQKEFLEKFLKNGGVFK